MKSIQVNFRNRKSDILYGSKGIFGQKVLEYYLIIIDPNASSEETIVCCIGTLESAFCHPDYPKKKQFTNQEMAELWRNAGVPESDVILLLASLPV